MTALEVLRNEFEKLAQDLIDKYVQLGMRASGQWAAELSVEVVEIGSRLVAKAVGLKYSEQLVYGRRPGRMPPVQAIEEWLRTKGIRALNRNMKLRSLAWAIAKKIAFGVYNKATKTWDASKGGTRYWREGGTDLVSSVVTPERIMLIIEKVADTVKAETIAVMIADTKVLGK